MLGKIRNFTCIFALMFGSEERYADCMNFRPHSMKPVPLLVFRAARKPRFPSLLRTVIPSRFIFCIIFFREAKIRETERRRPHTQLRGQQFSDARCLRRTKKKRSRNAAICVFLFSRPVSSRFREVQSAGDIKKSVGQLGKLLFLLLLLLPSSLSPLFVLSYGAKKEGICKREKGRRRVLCDVILT